MVTNLPDLLLISRIISGHREAVFGSHREIQTGRSVLNAEAVAVVAALIGGSELQDPVRTFFLRSGQGCYIHNRGSSRVSRCGQRTDKAHGEQTHQQASSNCKH